MPNERHEELKKKYKELEEKVELGSNPQEIIDIEILAQFKKAGSRRSPNLERPVPNYQPAAKPKLFNCERCSFKSVSEERLKIHNKRNHFTCDLCDITLGTACALRAHNKNVHKAPGGTAHTCQTCDFSALNEAHLKKHASRHHKELKCSRCDFKTLKESDMAEHVRYQHKRQVMQCKFGFNCRKRLTCRFEHPTNAQRPPPMRAHNQNIDTPWMHPAFVSQSAYNTSFPFLVQAMWKMSRNRGA